MKIMIKLAFTAMVAITLSACTGISNQGVGTIAGGALGGFLGNQIGGGGGKVVATIGGTLLGAYLGNQIGQSMDEVDQLRMERAMGRNQSTSWQGKNGAEYTLKPKRRHGRCRNYTMQVYMHGRSRMVHGRACLNRRGQWVNQ